MRGGGCGSERGTEGERGGARLANPPRPQTGASCCLLLNPPRRLNGKRPKRPNQGGRRPLWDSGAPTGSGRGPPVQREGTYLRLDARGLLRGRRSFLSVCSTSQLAALNPDAGFAPPPSSLNSCHTATREGQRNWSGCNKKEESQRRGITEELTHPCTQQMDVARRDAEH